MTKRIATVRELIDALGGPAEAGRILGGASPQRVWNWGAANKIPAEHYLRHRQVLSDRAIDAPDSLWFGEADLAPFEASASGGVQ